MRRTDTVTRLGGDEFVIIVESGPDAIDFHALRGKLLKAIERPQIHDGIYLTVGASIGGARFPSDGTSCDSLLAHADRSMYEDKSRVRER